MTLSTFPTFLTFLTFGLVRAGWLKLVTTEMDGRAIHRWRINPPAFLRGTSARKVRKVRKGMRVMTVGTFPAFLTFLTRKLCFATPPSGRWQGLEVPPNVRRERLESPTVGPKGNVLAERPDSASAVTMAPRRLPDRRGHELLDFEHSGIRYTAGFGHFEDGRLAEIFLNTAKHGAAIDVSARDAAVAASLLFQHGCQVDTLRRALTRISDGSASGPLARVLYLLSEEP